MNVHQEIIYPQFRKYINSKSYFKIYSPEKMDELKALGDKFYKNHLIARILPDRNFIYDLTYDYHKHCIKISEEEYNAVEVKSIS